VATDPQDIERDPYTEDPSTVIGRGSVPAATNPPLALSCTFAAHELVAERYEVVQFLGGGSMGEVYEANDTTLNLHVALKVIRPEIAADKRAVARFFREIQLARKVTHPNVCRIFDVGFHRSQNKIDADSEFPDAPFLTMELLRGETLADRLGRGGPMTTGEALPILQQVAAGLDAAHQAGVVHRDFKCGNVILVPAADSKRAVVTDFGLARTNAADDSTSGSISLVDEIVGTPEYMAPEQVKGLAATSAIDIYALGVAIYAMVTCHYPFKGDSSRETALMRLEEEPPAPHTYVADLDSTWETVILRCLARDPNDRFQCATDVVKALLGEASERTGTVTPSKYSALRFVRQHRAATLSVLGLLLLAVLFAAVPDLRHTLQNISIANGVPEDKQLAVLPFTALSGDRDDAAFARGLSETLTARLTKLTERHSLQVIPSTEIRSSKIDTVRQARQEFGVNLGLEGVVERSGPMVRVTYHLVDAKHARQLHGDTITAPASDPFSLQDAVATSVERALEIELQPQERSALTPPRTTEPVAYDFLLQGRGYLQEYIKPGNLENAISEFNHALELDANYAPAYAGLGEAYWYSYEGTRDPSWVNKATEACGRALQRDERSAQAHNCLGTVYQGTGKYELAALQFQRALDLEPTSDDAVRGLASAYAYLNKPAEAEETYRRAISLRPQYWRGYNMLGAFYYAHARYDDAAKMFRQVIALAPDNYRGYSNLGAMYLLQGRYADAIPLFERAVSIQPTADAYSNLGSTYFRLRHFPEAARTFVQAVKLNDRDYTMWGNLADAEERIPVKRSQAIADYKKAIAMAEQELQVNPRDTTVLSNLADYYSMVGNRDKALTSLAQSLALAPDDPSVSFKAAQVYEQLGDSNDAVKWLAQALKQGYSPTSARDDPALDTLRLDPRVQTLLQSR
jgi:serine/threonine protein kinase/tetratricopeptide (TPR) repeat protein